MKFYLIGQSHTAASALSPALERRSDGKEFVSCTLMHPLDDHLEVEVPSEKLLRDALLDLKDHVGRLRADVAAQGGGSSHGSVCVGGSDSKASTSTCSTGRK